MPIGSSHPPRRVARRGDRAALLSLRVLSGRTVLRLRSLARRLVAGRPPIAWSLALLFSFKGLICMLTFAFPISSSEPTRLVACAGVIAIVAAAAVWVFATRIPMLGFQLLAAGGSVVTSLLVAHATRHGGMMLAAFAYPWIAIYAAHFFPRRAVTAQGLVISVGFAAGLIFSGLPHVAVYWLVVTVTIWSICILLGNLSESLRRQAGTDHLTGLLNRSGLLTAAQYRRAIADRTGSPMAVALIDLDGFKQINDRAGHAAGDSLLAELAEDWRAHVRAGDVLARYGGDEFVLLLPFTTPSQARSVLERLSTREHPIGWSSGISAWLADESLDAALARADRDLYAAKAARRSGEAAATQTPVDGYCTQEPAALDLIEAAEARDLR